MLQCSGCGAAIDPESGPRKPLGQRRTVRDRHGNEIIVEVTCQDCTDPAPSEE
jgi:hypothetical protein